MSADHTADDLPSGPPGYELLNEVGRGAMGVVYRARDTAVGRDVAVKLLQHRFVAGGSAGRRFLDEARITGQLQHPGIPPVHQVGTLPDGRPFLAMKLIKGETLTEVLAGNPDRGRLLAVFEGVCQAVGYAHAHGVIHRDLKPANVMVGAFGEVQVMDWGLAKLVDAAAPPAADPDATAPGTEVESLRAEGDRTQDGQALGTPAYMPPEQAIGAVAEVDRRSDVFGLGAVLCHLLTGHPPYRGGDAASTRALAARAKLDDAFDRLTGCGADPEVVALCRRCLSADRADRPADAGAVAAAVAALRAAADERARAAEIERERTAVRAAVRAAEGRKRLRVMAVAGGLVLAAVTAGGLAAGVQWRRAEVALAGKSEQFERAETNRQQAEQNLADGDVARMETVRALRKLTEEFVEEQFAGKPELTAADRRFLQEVLGLWRTAAATRGDTPQARLMRAEGAHRVAYVQESLGERAEAEAAYRSAVAEYDRLATDDPTQLDHRFGLAACRTNLSRLMLDSGRPGEAETLSRAAIVGWEQLVADHPANLGCQRGLAGGFFNLGRSLAETGRAAPAEAAYRSALTVWQRLAARPDAPADYRSGVAKAWNALGPLLSDRGQTTEAEAAYRAAQDVSERLVADFPAATEYREQLAGLRTNLGEMLNQAGRSGEAEPVCRAALLGWERLAADFPAKPVYREGLATLRANLSSALMRTGRAAEAEPLMRVALGEWERLLAGDRTRPNYRHGLANAHINLGDVMRALERPAEAEASYRTALGLLDPLTADQPAHPVFRWEQAKVYVNLGVLLTPRRPADAETAYRAALSRMERVVADHPDRADHRNWLALTRNNLGLLLASRDRLSEAEELYHAAVADWERLIAGQPTVPAFRHRMGAALTNLGNVARYRNRPTEALSLFDRAVKVLSLPSVGPTPPDLKRFVRNAHLGRAKVLQRLGRPADSLADWDQAVAHTTSADRPVLRAERATALALAGRTDLAVAEAAELTGLAWPWTAVEWYDFACVYALASNKFGDKREEYAGRAVALLRKAVAAGYRDRAHMLKDTDLDPLRGRADFRAVLATMPELAPAPRPVR